MKSIKETVAYMVHVRKRLTHFLNIKYLLVARDDRSSDASGVALPCLQAEPGKVLEDDVIVTISRAHISKQSIITCQFEIGLCQVLQRLRFQVKTLDVFEMAMIKEKKTVNNKKKTHRKEMDWAHTKTRGQ